MEPGVQFVNLDKAESNDRWRLLAGPIGSAAPSFVRQAIYLYDTHLSAGASIDLPTMPGFDRWLYVFRGAVSVGNKQAETHTALTIGADKTALEVTATGRRTWCCFWSTGRRLFPRRHAERVIVENS